MADITTQLGQRNEHLARIADMPAETMVPHPRGGIHQRRQIRVTCQSLGGDGIRPLGGIDPIEFF